MIIFLIPLSIGIIAYKVCLKVVDRDAQEASLSSLKQCMTTLDSRFEDVENMATQLSMDTNVLSFAYQSNPSVDPTAPCKINDVKDRILPFTLTNNFISMTSVYFKKSDITILNNNSYLSQEQLYGQFFRYNNMNINEWQDKIINSNQYKTYFPVVPVFWRDEYSDDSWKEQSMLMYMQSFPFGSFDIGKIMVLIPKGKIQDLLADILSQKSCVYITDSKNNLLASFSTPPKGIDIKKFKLGNYNGFSEQKISGQDMIVVHTTSQFNGWRYIAIIPYKVILQKVKYISQLIYFILLISLILGFLGIFIMAYRNSRPLRKIFAIVRDRFEGNELSNTQNDYSYLRKSILNLISNNKSMELSLNKQLKMLKSIFIEKLVSGGFSNFQEVQFYIDQLKMKMFDGKIAVVIAHIEQSGEGHTQFMLEEYGAIKILIKDSIEKYLGTNVYYHELDFDKRTIIFNVDKAKCGKEKAYVEEILSNVCRDVYESQDTYVSFTTGTLSENYLSVSRSFDEAKEALEYNKLHIDRHILWYYDIPRKDDSYYYPIDIEMLLINYTNLGNIMEVRKVIQRIHRENFQKSNTSGTIMIHLAHEIEGTILKILNMLTIKHKESVDGIRLKFNSFQEYSSSENIFDFVLSIYEDLCSIATEGKKNKSDTISQILIYLNTNYTDSQLCLTSLAGCFKFSPVYLSQLFKEEIGENFSVYLEKIRMKKACELLKKGEQVNKVAQYVGYNDVHSFRNAFKRSIGLAPSDYKLKRESAETDGF